MNADELRLLICKHAIAEGIEISKTRDIETAIRVGSKLRHIVIASNGSLYIDGWTVNYVPTPDAVGWIKVHDLLPEDSIRQCARRFSDSLRSSR